jgi:hypothetical protein
VGVGDEDLRVRRRGGLVLCIIGGGELNMIIGGWVVN